MRLLPGPDSFNPLLVREMRRMVRSRLVVWAIVLYQLALVAFTTHSCINYMTGFSDRETYGREMLVPLALSGSAFTLLVVVLHTVFRVVDDRCRQDMAFYTTLTPGRNLRGRLACGFLISLLFLCMTMPCLCVTYLFRGVDPWVYFAVLPVPLLVVFLFNLLALAVFSAVRHPQQIPFYAFLFLGILALIGWGGQLIWLIIQSALSTWRWYSSYPHHSYWKILETEILRGILVFFALIFVPITSWFVARCNLSPFASNRMRPLRSWFTGFLLFTLLFAVVESLLHDVIFPGSWYRNAEVQFLLEAWVRFVAFLLSAMLLFAVCERDTWEGRVRRSIPKSRLRRLLVFPFYTGSINALVWVFLWTFFCCVAFSIMLIRDEIFAVKKSSDFTSFRMFQHMVFLTLIFDYSMTAYFLWRKILHRLIAKEMIWTLTLGLIATSSTLGFILAMIFQTGPFEIKNSLVHAGNPFFVLYDDYFDIFQCILAFLWFVTIMLSGYPWLKSRFLDFTPKEPANNESGTVSPDTDDACSANEMNSE